MTAGRGGAWQRVRSTAAVTTGALGVAFGASGVTLAILSRVSLDWVVFPIMALGFAVVGTLVALHQPRNAVGWIFLAVATLLGACGFAFPYGFYAYGDTVAEPRLPLAGTVTLLSSAWLPGLGLLFTYVLLLFPDGAPPSRRWRPVAWLSALPLLGYAVLLPSQWPLRGPAYLQDVEAVNRAAYGASTEVAVVDTLSALLAAATLAGLASLVWRFLHAGPALRRQLMWIVYAATVTTVVLWIGILSTASTPLYVLVAPLVPVAAGIAIFRYRLYDIDVIIRRTLVYGVVMAILIVLYLVSVFLLQRLVLGVVGARSQVAVAAATLLIAALFTPLRRAVSRFIERRFYRSRVDAEQALHAVTETLRNEVEPTRLTGAVLGVIDRSLRPEHVSLWLRDGDEPR